MNSASHLRAKPKAFATLAILLVGSMVATAQTTNIAIAPNKLNVLYIGVDNPISVAASAGTDDKVTVSITGGGGTISKIGTGIYNVRVAEITDECVMSVYVDGKLAGASTFRVRKLPAPSGFIGAYESGATIPPSVFQAQPGVGVGVKNFPFEVKYEMVSFTFNVDGDNGEIKSADCQGNSFSSTAIGYINQYVKPGRTVTIDKIRVKDPGGKEWTLPSIVYYIK